MIFSVAVIPPVVCAGIVLAFSLWARVICAKLDLLDIPDARKHHKIATPLMGGIALQFAVVPATISVALYFASPPWTERLLIMAAAVAAMTIVGLADDRHTLSARNRLVASFLVFGSAALIDPVFNVRVLDFEHPPFQLGLGTGLLAVIFTTICCVGLVNAVNMADGKNGLVIGLSLGWLILIGARAPSPLMLLTIAVLAGALLVLLVFNLKGLLFLGDGGSYGIATAIALLAITTYNYPGTHAGRAISAGELMLLFAIPVIDSFRLTFARLGRGQSPMSPDRDHLHHHLQNRFGWPIGLVVYLVIALAPAALILLN